MKKGTWEGKQISPPGKYVVIPFPNFEGKLGDCGGIYESCALLYTDLEGKKFQRRGERWRNSNKTKQKKKSNQSIKKKTVRKRKINKENLKSNKLQKIKKKKIYLDQKKGKKKLQENRRERKKEIIRADRNLTEEEKNVKGDE